MYIMRNIEHIGENNLNSYGTEMCIVEYIDYNDVIIEFQDSYKVRKRCSYKEFKNGKVKNPYDRSVFGVGYIGEGGYPISINSRATKCYDVWRSMLLRCYDSKFHEKEPSYMDCKVVDSWLCYQNFAKWFEDNYYELPNEKTQLDKDILIPGNKVYGPDNCAFVPINLNQIFVKFTKRINSETNVKGVRKYNDKYLARGVKNGRMVHLGYFNTLDEAVTAYDNFLKNKLHEVAEKYKGYIPEKVFKAIINRC